MYARHIDALLLNFYTIWLPISGGIVRTSYPKYKGLHFNPLRLKPLSSLKILYPVILRQSGLFLHLARSRLRWWLKKSKQSEFHQWGPMKMKILRENKFWLPRSCNMILIIHIVWYMILFCYDLYLLAYHL